MGGIMFLYCIAAKEPIPKNQTVKQSLDWTFSMKELYVDSNGYPR